MSYLDYYNQPIGIVQSWNGQNATVLTQGIIDIPFSHGSLVPGKNYYSNSMGNYIEGEWVGERGMESYYIYMENNEMKMITEKRNCIGFAISQQKMMVKTKRSN